MTSPETQVARNDGLFRYIYIYIYIYTSTTNVGHSLWLVVGSGIGAEKIFHSSNGSLGVSSRVAETIVVGVKHSMVDGTSFA